MNGNGEIKREVGPSQSGTGTSVAGLPGIPTEALETFADLVNRGAEEPGQPKELEMRSMGLAERLKTERRIPLNKFVTEEFRDINMPPRHREYIESFAGINLTTSPSNEVFRIVVDDSRTPEEVIRSEFNDGEIVTSYNVVEGADGTRTLEVFYVVDKYFLEGDQGAKVDLGDIINGVDAIHELFAGGKSSSHPYSDIVDGLLVGIRDYMQMKMGIGAGDWTKKLMENRGNCLDNTVFKLIILQLYPRYSSRIRGLTPIGYTGNMMMSGAEGYVQHYGLAYLDQDGNLALMPGGGIKVNENGFNNSRIYASNNHIPNRSLSARSYSPENRELRDREKMLKGERALKAQVLHMARAAREYFPEETKRFLKALNSSNT